MKRFALLLITCLAFDPTPFCAGQTNNTVPVTRRSPTVEQSKPRPLPYHGKVTAVDVQGRTFTIGRRTFQVTSRTRIQKDGAPAKLDAGAVGESASGSYFKEESGKLIARSLYVGERAGTNAGTRKSSKN
jgi:hypothetical protein